MTSEADGPMSGHREAVAQPWLSSPERIATHTSARDES
ncbi:hypothetical protein N177_2339 [Lutibaculum baratangense AMV1]|uniref:Uncharacterized protein n=1 Tax=Lutibaculum baratangense AMV1 TaxID=631454 RepID=V4RMS0_9HYPH|nr:hypothetical protein N177_2339 [Lutibaculum baratangense AMV1]